MGSERAVMKDTITFSFLKYAAFGLVLISTTVLLKLLPISSFGIYSAIVLALNYSRFGFLIPYSASFKKIPFIRGMGKSEQEVQEIRELTFSSSFYLMLAASVITFFVSFALDRTIAPAVRILSVLILLQHYNFFYTNFLRIDKKFNIVGYMEVILVLSRLILFLILVKPYGLTGALFSFVMSFIITIALGHAMHNYWFGFKISSINKKALQLWKFGLPTAAVGIFATIFITIDKVMIINFFDSNTLGYYSFGVFVIEVITFIPSIITAVIFPRQIEYFGNTRDKTKLMNYLIQPLMIIAFLLPFVISGAFFFSEMFIRYFVPKYIPATGVVMVLIYSTYFLAASRQMDTFLIAINKEKNILLRRFVLILVAVALNILFITKGYGITGVAAATLISFILEYFYLLYVSFSNLGMSGKEMIKKAVVMIAPFVYMCIILYSTNLIMISYANEIIMQIIRYAASFILFLPMVYYLNKKTNIIGLLLSMKK